MMMMTLLSPEGEEDSLVPIPLRRRRRRWDRAAKVHRYTSQKRCHRGAHCNIIPYLYYRIYFLDYNMLSNKCVKGYVKTCKSRKKCVMITFALVCSGCGRCNLEKRRRRFEDELAPPKKVPFFLFFSEVAPTTCTTVPPNAQSSSFQQEQQQLVIITGQCTMVCMRGAYVGHFGWAFFNFHPKNSRKKSISFFIASSESCAICLAYATTGYYLCLTSWIGYLTWYQAFFVKKIMIISVFDTF